MSNYERNNQRERGVRGQSRTQTVRGQAVVQFTYIYTVGMGMRLVPEKPRIGKHGCYSRVSKTSFITRVFLYKYSEGINI